MRTELLKAVTIALALAGCADGAECPEGYELNGYCQKVTPAPGDGDGDGDEDAGPAGDGDGDAVCALEPEFEDGFNSPCTDAENHSDCTCGADYCALMPGQDEGYCTFTDCMDDPSICPEGSICFDLSFVEMGLSVCYPTP